MKHHIWSPEKNEKLKTSRDVSFEDVIFYIEAGNLLDIVSHPNQATYPGQKMYVVDIEGYIYLVPFVESEQEVFLKTIVPSRKATKHYLRHDLGAKHD